MLRTRLTVGIVIGLAVCAGVVSGTRASQAPGNAIAIDSDDLAGTVTGPSGPEAGVWVIAETTDLPTPFVKIVVTDDRGRYLVPDLPKANYRVWVRGYGLVDSPKTQTSPGRTLDLRAVAASSPAAAAQYYPAAHWLSLMEMPGQAGIPGHRRRGQWHLAEHEEPGRLDSQREVRGLHGVPCAGHQGHAGDSGGARLVPHERRGVGSAREVGAGGRADERRAQSVRPRARAEDVRGLDRPHPCRRSAACARTAAGHGAQRGHHAVGLGRSQGLSARRGVDRPQESAPQCERAALRRTRTERRLRPRAESGHSTPRAVCP